MKAQGTVTLVCTAITVVVLGFVQLNADAAISITSIEDLQKIGNDSRWPLDGDYVLTKDIDAAATSGWNSGAGFAPIGKDYDTPFTGSFDGQDHVITGLTINRSDQDRVGLFGYIGEKAFLKNLALKNCLVTSTSYEAYVGGLVGHNDGTISACYVTGTVTGTGYYVYVGGLVGANEKGTIRASYATGKVTGSGSDESYVGGLVGGNDKGGAITVCYATGTVTGTGAGNSDYTLVGGLVGGNDGTVRASYATGAVTGSGNDLFFIGGLVGANGEDGTISVSYATGKVKGTGTARDQSFVGGLVGQNYYGSITDCYATGGVAGTGYHVFVGGFAGYNYGSIAGCYAAGAVTGSGYKSYLGGFLGYNYHATVTGCYWDTDTSGQMESDGGKGHTTYLMTYPNDLFYVGWDFENTWVHDVEGNVNNGYPYLKVFSSAPENEDEGGGCFKAGDKSLFLPKLMQKVLSDWLLIGVSLMGLGIF